MFKTKHCFSILVIAAAAVEISACAPPEPETTEPREHTATSSLATKAPFELPNSLLPFDMPARADLATSEYKVFAHWHNFPLRVYGSSSGQYYDQYTRWLQPTGTYASIGGYLRDRPIPILAIPPAESDYLKRDMKQDIQTAAAVGVDGFLFNLWFRTTDARWKWLTELFNAADEFNTENPSAPFAVIPNIDAHILSTNSGKDEPRQRADDLATFKTRASWKKLNGKYVVGSFRPEALPVTWWQQFFDQLKTVHGIDAVLWGTLLDPTEANRNALKPFMVGATFSRWDNLPYTSNPLNGINTLKAWGDQNGVPYSPPVSHTDNRPTASITTETAGFKTQYNTWKAAIDSGVKMVQILTWNDHYEGHALRPNSAVQYAFYDLTAYYTTWFKTRQQPVLVRDVLYYSHRMHLSTEPYNTTLQPIPTASKNGVTLVDRVFLLAMLKSSGRVQITSGGTAYTADVLAGPQFFDAPLKANDQPSFQLSRSGAPVINFTSAFHTRSPIVWQDLLYRAGGSSRPVVTSVQDNLPQDRLP
ncbi:hypothetical protein JY651_42380 [Pyxidicoccus parkwayensis]|uniref:Glycosyl hydrolase family 71 n=1 Tax=Pyxidicoccus parkwayensis TaxID=2813578 RepID=A0ABX7NS67_9BACT|nr:endo-1,3-alpha-glucanase family glycosylhydrolase [Pyxidicoccus parkwaysis]QSQ21735.1 hypothetical protein JY651_42380 [Pyxidicoccus parkwaysis]